MVKDGVRGPGSGFRFRFRFRGPEKADGPTTMTVDAPPLGRVSVASPGRAE